MARLRDRGPGDVVLSTIAAFVLRLAASRALFSLPVAPPGEADRWRALAGRAGHDLLAAASAYEAP